VVAIRLGNDKKGPGFDSLTKPMKDAVKKLFDKMDAQAAQSNQSTTAPTNANPAPTKLKYEVQHLFK